MLGVAYNGVFLLDAVVEDYLSSEHVIPFTQWWSSLSQEAKTSELLRVILHKFGGEAFHTKPEEEGVPYGTR